MRKSPRSKKYIKIKMIWSSPFPQKGSDTQDGQNKNWLCIRKMKIGTGSKKYN